MKTLTIGSMLVLLAIGSGVLSQSAFADHSEVVVDMPLGTAYPGCEVDNMCFRPTDAIVDVGGSVTWTNSDMAGHTVESGTIDEGTGIFGTGLSLLPPGESYTFKFDDIEPGTYPYVCLVHLWMSGTVTVVAAGENEEVVIEDPSDTYVLSDGTTIKIKSGEPAEGERLEIAVLFVDSEHVNYAVTVTQSDETVLEDIGAHKHQGVGRHMTEPLPSSDAVDVAVTFQGYGVEEPFTGDNIGEEAIFTGIVPEFGAVAVIILGVAVAGTVAATARSGIVQSR